MLIYNHQKSFLSLVKESTFSQKNSSFKKVEYLDNEVHKNRDKKVHYNKKIIFSLYFLYFEY